MPNPHPLKVAACEAFYGYHHVKWSRVTRRPLACYRCGCPQGTAYRLTNLLVEYIGPNKADGVEVHRPLDGPFTKFKTVKDGLAFLGVGR